MNKFQYHIRSCFAVIGSSALNGTLPNGTKKQPMSLSEPRMCLGLNRQGFLLPHCCSFVLFDISPGSWYVPFLNFFIFSTWDDGILAVVGEEEEEEKKKPASSARLFFSRRIIIFLLFDVFLTCISITSGPSSRHLVST